jgi:DNA-binding MarR family transcriptional regulator
MTLEDELQQARFANPYHRVALNIHFTSSWLSGLSHQLLKPYGISNQQFNVLRILRGCHPETATMGAITQRMVDKMSNATRLVDKLRKKDLVVREVNADNRRQVDVCITEKGLALLRELDSVMEHHIHRMRTLDEAEASQLSQLLDKLRG